MPTISASSQTIRYRNASLARVLVCLWMNSKSFSLTIIWLNYWRSCCRGDPSSHFSCAIINIKLHVCHSSTLHSFFFKSSFFAHILELYVTFFVAMQGISTFYWYVYQTPQGEDQHHFTTTIVAPPANPSAPMKFYQFWGNRYITTFLIFYRTA